MKRILSTLVLLTMVLAATADDEELYVAGTKLDLKKTYSQEYLNGDLGGGYFYYSPSANKLTLVGVTIKRSGDGKNGIDCKVAGLKVVFQGINSIQTSAACIKLRANTTIENEGYVDLNCTGSNEGIYIMNTTTIDINGGTWKIKSPSGTGIEGKDKNQTVNIYDDTTCPLFLTVNGKNGCVLDLKALNLYNGLNVCDPIYLNYINSPSHTYVSFQTALYVDGTNNVIKDQDVVIGTPAFELGGQGFATGNTDIKASTISGSVTYNHSTKTLRMSNANTTYGAFKPYLDGMKLELIGSNTLSYIANEDYNSSIDCSNNLTIQGDGQLITGPILLNKSDLHDIYYLDIKGGATVNIINNKDKKSGISCSDKSNGVVRINASTLNITVKSSTICSWVGIILNGSVIDSPSIIRLTASDALMRVMNDDIFFCYDLDRATPHKGELSIVPGTAYKLWVNGVRVNNKNYARLSSALDEGTCSFNPTTKTLTLNNAKIAYPESYYDLYPAIYNSIDGLVIKNSGTSEIGGSFNGIVSEADLTIKGNGHLKVNGTGARNAFGAIKLTKCDLTIDNTELTATGGYYAIFASSIDYTQQKGCVHLNNSYLHLSSAGQAVKVLAFDPNCAITYPVGGINKGSYITESNGTTVAKKVEIVPKKGIVTTIDTATPAGEAGETSIYTTSGTLVWQGAGQPQLPRGIYIMKKNGKVQKVQKN